MSKKTLLSAISNDVETFEFLDRSNEWTIHFAKDLKWFIRWESLKKKKIDLIQYSRTNKGFVVWRVLNVLREIDQIYLYHKTENRFNSKVSFIVGMYFACLSVVCVVVWLSLIPTSHFQETICKIRKDDTSSWLYHWKDDKIH
jgi:hypothetical protein